ncbi:MAG: PEP-CTERM sorting domain-containing protein [Verrucomicrobia bacterium]|nr:PEP-CTERM sorting domain-containing protein [Verrucomicrobiota bacterium]
MLATLSAGISSSGATLIFEEYFDYELNNNNNIGGNTGGVWNAGTNNVRFQTAAGPTFTGTGYLPTHAGGRLESGNTNSADVRMSHAPLGQAISGEFWVSVFVNANSMTNVNGSITQMSFSTNSNTFSNYGGPGFGLYNDGANLNFALFNGSAGAGGVAAVGSPATANEWHLLVARVTINESADDAISVWAFGLDAAVPNSVSNLGTPVATSITLDFGSSINTLGIGGQSFTTTGGKTALWDDIRLSVAAGDTGLREVLAIPEPATYAAIFGILVLGLAIARRRRVK